MNKTQLIDALAANFEGNRKAAQHALESVLDTITREVARGEKVAITGFGSFEKRVREARWVRNPRTGERLLADKVAIPKFNPGADLKSVVAGLRELPQLAFDTAAAALPGAKKPAAKKPAAPAPAATKAPAKKAPATKKAAAKKTTATKKTAAKKATATKKTAAKKTTATKKTAAKKTTATKKTAAKKAT